MKFSRPTEQQATSAASKGAGPLTPLDASQPVTSIQIRLADGTRLVGIHFSLTHKMNIENVIEENLQYLVLLNWME